MQDVGAADEQRGSGQGRRGREGGHVAWGLRRRRRTTMTPALIMGTPRPWAQMLLGRAATPHRAPPTAALAAAAAAAGSASQRSALSRTAHSSASHASKMASAFGLSSMVSASKKASCAASSASRHTASLVNTLSHLHTWGMGV